ncbi:phage tail assembly chaperone [Methylobacterium flocculans]|uniref:phage tail assembly chaperone n=1 Tax=Methylobacterium flocculans TaxID=2984843 RepID=UPI0021F31A18|nr:phage tail assembly chaperone [Methylobacterium sp. FF17]
MSPTGGSAPEPPSAFPWDEALALGLGRLRWRPRDFWRATPRELMAAAGLTAPRTLDRAGLRDLIARHPDPT